MTKHPFLEFDSQEQKEKLIFLDDQRLLQRVVRSNLGTYFFFVENSRRFVGKIRWDSKSHRKIPHTCTGKNTGIFTSICRGTASHNVYLMENSSKLKTVCLHRSEHKSKMKRAILLVRRLWLNNSE